MLKKYMIFIAILTGISIVLGMSYSNFIVASENHKVAEMYVGRLKYSMTINGSTKRSLTIEPEKTIIVDVNVTNENPIDTYYKLVYKNNTNLSVTYYESTQDTEGNKTNYNSPRDKIQANSTNNIKLKIVNNSTSSQKVNFGISGGFATNTLEDVIIPSTGTEIKKKDESTNTYFCATTDTLTQGLQYINGQYTYAYKLQSDIANGGEWSYIYAADSTGIVNEVDGWGVIITDKKSADAVTSKLCTYINNKPLVSMSSMFFTSQAPTIDVSSFNTGNIINMEGMFAGSKATSLNLSNFDTSNVTSMYRMFDSSQATTLDLSSFDTSNVTSMGEMFDGSSAITLDLSNFNTSNVTNMYNMFAYSSATTLDVSKFNTSKVTDMRGMFRNGQATTIDISNFNTSKVTDMSDMFYSSKNTTIDVSNFDTSNVTNMSYMFANAKATVLDVSNFNTSKATNMSCMFCSSQATILDVSKFDTSNVTNMSSMFSYSEITTLDLSNFNTSKVTDMSYMFRVTSNLKTIYVSDKFLTTAVTNSTDMFKGATSLVGGAGTKYDSTKTDKTYARIDGGTSNPGYFTDAADKNIPAPNSFATDSWKTIIKAVRNNNISKYSVGATKTIDMGTYGTHTIRIANKSTPNECSRAGFSQTACGFVLEFADIITTHKMNDTNTNVGGWPATSMRTFVNNDIYNAIPSEIKNAIIDTTVVSGHGSTSGETNFTSTDKLYLLSTAEVWADAVSSSNGINGIDEKFSILPLAVPEADTCGVKCDNARNVTRQLDYYKNLGTTPTNYSGAIKKNGTSASVWWLRAAKSTSTSSFYRAYSNGYCNTDGINTYGVSPAFRIG